MARGSASGRARERERAKEEWECRISWDRAKARDEQRGCGMKRRGHMIKGKVGQGSEEGRRWMGVGMKGRSEEEGKVDRRATCFCDTSLGTGPNDYRQLRQITIICKY